MKKTSKDLIELLNAPEEAKSVLRKIYKVASSENNQIKETVKDIFVTCPEGAGLSEYAHAYEKIIVENDVYRVKGKETYIELAFPRLGGEKEYRKFFDSPRLVAATINDFVGVFLISFEQWASYNELMREAFFDKLLQFIDDNKNKVSFVFHVLPEFVDSDKLANLLNSHINIIKVELKKPNVYEAIEYVKEELRNKGIKVDNHAEKCLEEFISEKIKIESKSYVGYSTLDKLTQDISFEIICMCDEDINGVRVVNEAMMSELFDNTNFTLDDKNGQIKFGFL